MKVTEMNDEELSYHYNDKEIKAIKQERILERIHLGSKISLVLALGVSLVLSVMHEDYRPFNPEIVNLKEVLNPSPAPIDMTNINTDKQANCVDVEVSQAKINEIIKNIGLDSTKSADASL